MDRLKLAILAKTFLFLWCSQLKRVILHFRINKILVTISQDSNNLIRK